MFADLNPAVAFHGASGGSREGTTWTGFWDEHIHQNSSCYCTAAGKKCKNETTRSSRKMPDEYDSPWKKALEVYLRSIGCTRQVWTGKGFWNCIGCWTG